MPSKKIFCILSVVLALALLDAALCLGEQEVVTLTMPEKIIRQAIQESLPLPIDTNRETIEGNLVLETIDNFTLGQNSASLHGVLVGQDIVLRTRIGNQDLRLKLGEMLMPFRCDVTFRFDPAEKKLYVTPNFTESMQDVPPEKADKVLPVLALLNNREYPLSFDNMQQIETRVGPRQLLIDLEPVDIKVEPGMLVVKMLPKVSKTH